MKNKGIAKILSFILLFLLSGCGNNNEEIASEVFESELDIAVKSEPEELLDAFLAGEIPAIYDDREESAFTFDQLPFDEGDYFSYSEGERIDLDNDGESEQIVNGPYGGKYLDARDGKVYVLAEGEGTTGVLFYTNYDNAIWIVHSDTTHVGREMYWLTRYDGEGNIVDEFQLGAEYWDSPDDILPWYFAEMTCIRPMGVLCWRRETVCCLALSARNGLSAALRRCVWKQATVGQLYSKYLT